MPATAAARKKGVVLHGSDRPLERHRSREPRTEGSRVVPHQLGQLDAMRSAEKLLARSVAGPGKPSVRGGGASSALRTFYRVTNGIAAVFVSARRYDSAWLLPRLHEMQIRCRPAQTGLSACVTAEQPMLQFHTAGESHGQALMAWISGLPAGLRVDFDFINGELHRRQLGYGRGGRQKIEKDHVEALGGHPARADDRRAHRAAHRESRLGQLGDTPWRWRIAPRTATTRRPLTAPRPGHADLAGALKFNFHDARYILERASARETAARVALGALAKLLLREFGCEILSHVVAVGHVRLERAAAWSEIAGGVRQSRFAAALRGSGDRGAHEAGSRSGAARGRYGRRHFRSGGARRAVGLGQPRAVGRQARRPIGARGHVHPGGKGGGDWRGRGGGGLLRQRGAGRDRVRCRAARGSRGPANRAGGLEGGITNGEDVVVRGYLKPISTLRRRAGDGRPGHQGGRAGGL